MPDEPRSSVRRRPRPVPSPLPTFAAVATGAAIGALCRVEAVAAVSAGRSSAVVLAINVAGSVLLGALIGRWRSGPPPLIYHFLGTGFAGGFTTFSTFAVDVASRLERGELTAAVVNGLGTPALAVLGAGIGYRLGRLANRVLVKRGWSRA